MIALESVSTYLLELLRYQNIFMNILSWNTSVYEKYDGIQQQRLTFHLIF